jgi:hypothetical protein
LIGTWSQGENKPLTFEREDAFAEAGKPSRVDGLWLGSLGSGSTALRIQARIRIDCYGKEHCSLDSLDQGAMAIPCEELRG